MFSYLKKNPLQVTGLVLLLSTLVMSVIALIAYLKVNDAKSKGLPVPEPWGKINNIAYIFAFILFFILVISICSQSSASCLMFYTLTNF